MFQSPLIGTKHLAIGGIFGDPDFDKINSFAGFPGTPFLRLISISAYRTAQ